MDEMSVDIRVGKDYRGDFIEHNMKDINNNIIGKITRQYYEIVDKEILKSMPSSILYDLEIKIHNEIKRRT